MIKLFSESWTIPVSKMKKLLRNITVIVIVSIAYPSETVSIEGVVLDSDGKPVKKAEVELTTAKKKKIDDTKSDKKGNFNDSYFGFSSKNKNFFWFLISLDNYVPKKIKHNISMI